ncbi:baculoviral IAP repeat-containing protein 2 [Chiloscyllium plagiosum]|uniref:baculoviral IAP repeat-containing protein 2 n=1 Tax=Chiloscyllium plagiosum TaxID=36176 RepID=UPI001CB82B2A|nr:baculoviral IAP repeat-containing protein 2 [Chiloscyllium plagiosum]XP_043547058.1 baculoviral IAP repeat-containing protein 2 [Chiloscyllium plagiosum]XP_043547059.1 baculoviral IAP repeat-containing protein 2 [Chiloscyllium plagiosum]XP_043547061.1 baculoviral IAP repeat-containing protein 2 [Chiloscyllium plagiosum]
MNILQNQNFGYFRIGRDQELQYDLTSELYRISTFAHFPSNALVSERSLARAGFYYTGVSDKVQCFSCGITVDNWQVGDNAFERHRRCNPSCSFIQSLPSVEHFSVRSTFSPPSATSLQSSFRENGAQIGLECSNPSDPVGSRSVEDVSHQLRYPQYSTAMCSEEMRLRTFQNWPSYSSLIPAELAKAGFYYTGEEDRVACFVCGGKLSNWEPGDHASSEHRRHFPSCPFVLGNPMGNIPMSNTESQRLEERHGMVQAVHPRHPEMQSYDTRLQTFLRWPVRNFIQPEQLSRAGFYYVGQNDDVKCYYCDGGLRSWEAGDDPWVEHAKWFPRCEYLLQEKGQTFVHQIQTRFPNLFDLQLHSSSDDILEETQTPVVHFGAGENRSEDAIMMNTPVVKGAMEMGFDRRLVMQSVQRKILTSGENYKSVIELVTDLLNAEDEERREDKERRLEEVAEDDVMLLKKNCVALSQNLTKVIPLLDDLETRSLINKSESETIKQRPQANEQARELLDTIIRKGNAAAEAFRDVLLVNEPELHERLYVKKNLSYSTSDLMGLTMEEQLRRLQEERTCKVCMDKEVSVVFIMCGHLVVCTDCAPSLRKCPICRGTIKGTVRTFLS